MTEVIVYSYMSFIINSASVLPFYDDICLCVIFQVQGDYSPLTSIPYVYGLEQIELVFQMLLFCIDTGSRGWALRLISFVF